MGENLELFNEMNQLMKRVEERIDVWKNFYEWAEANHPDLIKKFIADFDKTSDNAYEGDGNV